ncbi:Aste57867_1908 [Aphanomyces stellatus]|uniref:Aste57867_1908 protein n=1 Tax=Aphanomyces stellatus TaxID=120398 RepID=A0A485KAL5_9STRA|nr:hypothetical protein As57867_001906 [Aphanomyces stellatus]VFT79114.1 Aste57867_1908 [Aphanomyces stellatus]
MGEMNTDDKRNTKRREYFKYIKRIHRQEELQERLLLRQQVLDLEQTLAPLIAQRPSWILSSRARESLLLPWKDIAIAMKTERELAISQRKALSAKVKAHKALMLSMKEWVACNSALHGVLDGHVATWRNHSLPATPSARRLGMVWITEQMRHNTDRMFHRCGFPSISDDFALFDMQFALDTVGEIQYVWGHQGDFEYRDDIDPDFFCRHMCAMLMPKQPTPMDTVKEVGGHHFLHQLAVSDQVFVNVLTTSVRARDRFVVMAQTITDDEALEVDPSLLVRRMAFWLEVVRDPVTGTWRRRSLYCNARQQASVEREAAQWGLGLQDVHPDFRESKLRHHVMRFWPTLRLHVRDLLDAFQAKYKP